MKHKITYGEKYGPAMQVQTKEEAAAYFEECVEHTMEWQPDITREEAESIEKQNIGYYAGYYDKETYDRVMELFDTNHPIFGKAYLGSAASYVAGNLAGKEHNNG
jgi:hypothetical protein